MFVTVVATVCHLITAGPADAPVETCEATIVADSDSYPNLDFMSCLTAGELPVVEWLKQTHGEGYTLQRYMCVPGHYVLPGRA